MQLQTLLEAIRSRLGDTSTSRYTDAELTNRINEAQTILAQELRWPEVAVTFNTVANQQFYALPQNNGILRAYLGGQPLGPTSIEDLEGDQLNFYDNTSPTGGPQWRSEPPAAYPTLTPGGGLGTNFTTPWWTGMRPRYFLTNESSLNSMGGSFTSPNVNGPGQVVGFVPPPAGVVQAVFWTIALPSVLVNYTDYCQFPEICRMAIVWWVILTEQYTNNEEQDMAVAQAEYNQAIARARRWAEDQVMERSAAPRIVPNRLFYSRRRPRCN